MKHLACLHAPGRGAAAVAVGPAGERPDVPGQRERAVRAEPERHRDGLIVAGDVGGGPDQQGYEDLDLCEFRSWSGN